eukprot:g11860.t1
MAEEQDSPSYFSSGSQLQPLPAHLGSASDAKSVSHDYRSPDEELQPPVLQRGNQHNHILRDYSKERPPQISARDAGEQEVNRPQHELSPSGGEAEENTEQLYQSSGPREGQISKSTTSGGSINNIRNISGDDKKFPPMRQQQPRTPDIKFLKSSDGDFPKYYYEHVAAAILAVLAGGLFHLTPLLLGVAYVERWHLDPKNATRWGSGRGAAGSSGTALSLGLSPAKAISSVVRNLFGPIEEEGEPEAANAARANRSSASDSYVYNDHSASSSASEDVVEVDDLGLPLPPSTSSRHIVDVDSPRLRKQRRHLFRWWTALNVLLLLHAFAFFIYAVIVLWGSARTGTKDAFPLLIEALPNPEAGGVRAFDGQRTVTLPPAAAAAPANTNNEILQITRLHYGFQDAAFYRPEAQPVFGFERQGGNLYSGDHCLSAHMNAAGDEAVRVEDCVPGKPEQLWKYDSETGSFSRISFGGMNGGVVVRGAYLGYDPARDFLLADTGLEWRVRFPEAQVSSYAEPAALGFGSYLLISAFALGYYAVRLLKQKNVLRLWFREQGAGSPLRGYRKTWREKKLMKRTPVPKEGGLGFGFQKATMRGGFSRI